MDDEFTLKPARRVGMHPGERITSLRAVSQRADSFGEAYPQLEKTDMLQVIRPHCKS